MTITDTLKKKIVAKQENKCANKPDAQIKGMYDYKCNLWAFKGGKFDMSSYQIDHKIEKRDGGSDDESNLQALCPSCHAVKTKYYQKVPHQDIISIVSCMEYLCSLETAELRDICSVHYKHICGYEPRTSIIYKLLYLQKIDDLTKSQLRNICEDYKINACSGKQKHLIVWYIIGKISEKHGFKLYSS